MAALPAIPEAVRALIAQNAPVAVGVSGGKDGTACALSVNETLDDLGHRGPRILIHANLGLVEWADSGPSCERLAQRLNWPLHVTQRKQGGMMERWEQRWAANVLRYQTLSCVKVILPWSTPALRFCTSHLKTGPINSYLKKLFGKQPILSVTGIRADESPSRAKKPVCRANTELPAGSLDWNAILRWTKEDVFARIAAGGLTLHEAYRIFGASRVSCAFCIMSSGGDLLAALKDTRNLPVYVRMCALELSSGFAFQGGRWLSDIRPGDHAERLQWAKKLMAARERVERTIPKHLLFTKGWPKVMPTEEEAELLAGVRRVVCSLYGWEPTFTTPGEIIERYAELMRDNAAAKPAGHKSRKNNPKPG